MLFSTVLALLSASLVAANPRYYPGSKPAVCGGNTIAACCQTDEGNPDEEASLNCLSPGSPTSIKKFNKICAATGRTAECCQTLVDGEGTGCQDVEFN